MKSVCIFILFSFFINMASAQCISVLYSLENSVKMADALSEREKPVADDILQMQELIDNYSVKFKLDHFVGGLSIFERVDFDSGVASKDYDSFTGSFHLEQKDNIVIKSYNENIVIAQMFKHSRKFIVNDELSTYCWNIGKNVKNIAGFQCFNAETEIRGQIITAWFTLEVPVSNGPMEFDGLPGLILELDTGTIIYKALDVNLEENTCNDTINEIMIDLSKKQAMSLNQYYDAIDKKKGSKIRRNN